MKRLIGLVCWIVLPALTVLAQNPDDPYEWTIETYAFPADQLVHGFASPERGALRPPRLPAADATPEQIQDFIRISNSIVSHYLDEQGLGLPKGGLVIFDPESLTLAARLPRIAQSSILFTAEAFQEDAQKYLAFDFTMVEAPAAMLRSVAEKANEQANHHPLLEQMRSEVDEGRAKILFSSRLETQSGQRATLERQENADVATGITVDAENQVAYLTETQAVGTRLEVDSVIGADGETIDLRFSLDHHYLPARKRQAPLTLRGTDQLSSVLVDTTNVLLHGGVTMRTGTSKLLGVWKPEGIANDDALLQAAFTSGDVVTVLPLVNPRLADWLRVQGEAVLPVPEGDLEFEKEAEEIPDGMIVRRFRVPPSYLSQGRALHRSQDDPFSDLGGGGGGALEPTFMIRATARDILQSFGISFPPGSSANYISSSSTLVVRNTPENIQLVEAYVMSVKEEVQKTVGVTVQIVEAEASVLRRLVEETRALADHRAAWEELKAHPQTSILTTNWLETRSGEQAKIEAGRNHVYHTGAEVVAAKEGAIASQISPVQNTQRVGTIIGVDPVIGADGITIDLRVSIDHDYAEPQQIESTANIADGQIQLDGSTTTFRDVEVSSGMTLRSGMHRMISVWEPKGIPEGENADLLQAAWVQATLILMDEIE